MNQRYSQLIQGERYCLYTMSKQGTALREMAKAMGRSHTTLSRELRRNTGQRGYRHHQAQRLAEQRHQAKPKVLKLTETVVVYIQEKLQAWWSPEQICGRLWLEQAIALSPETVYATTPWMGIKERDAGQCRIRQQVFLPHLNECLS